MKPYKVTLISIILLIIAACSTSKKNTTSVASTTTATTTSSSSNMVASKPASGIYAPGNEELIAIQIQYKVVTLNKLQEGHIIYTEGACIKCHDAKNIYKRAEVHWKDIIEDMAQKAKISEAQKDAVYKYVLAIKATQPKEGK